MPYTRITNYYYKESIKAFAVTWYPIESIDVFVALAPARFKDLDLCPHPGRCVKILDTPSTTTRRLLMGDSSTRLVFVLQLSHLKRVKILDTRCPAASVRCQGTRKKPVRSDPDRLSRGRGC